MTEPKLKPCPFCGGEAKMVETYSGDIKIGCENLGCLGCYENNAFFSFKEDAIESWNKRVVAE